MTFSPWYEGKTDLRDVLLTALNDQDIEVYVYRRNSDGIVDSGTFLSSFVTSAVYVTYMNGFLGGYSFRFAVKNIGAATANNISLLVQAFGA